MPCILKKKNRKNIGDVSDLGLKHVKDTYKDVDEYLATFEPLLFEEVKAQILEGKDDEESNLLFPVFMFSFITVLESFREAVRFLALYVCEI